MERLASRRPSGATTLVFSSLLFGAMAFLAKQAARHAPGAEVAFVRFVVGALSFGGYAIVRPIQVVNWRALFLRGFFGGLAVLGFFLAIAHLPVGIATLLNYTQPIATALFAALFLGERLASATVGALALTSVGVVLVVNATAPVGELGFGPWQLVGLASAVLSGAAVTAIRWARRSDGPWEIFGAFCLIGAVVCAPVAAPSWVWPSATGWLLMIGVGVLSVLAQLLFIWALRYTPAATAGVITQLTPITALALGVVLLAEPWGWESLVGAGVTLLGVIWGARSGG